jgi:hypothetical protein
MGMKHDHEEDFVFENNGTVSGERSYDDNFAGSNYENYKDDFEHGVYENEDAESSYLEYNIDDEYGNYDKGFDYGELQMKKKHKGFDGVDKAECAKFSGAMQNIESNRKLKINGWSKCSKMEFDAFIKKNGGERFCLFIGQKISQSKCGFSSLVENEIKPKGKRRNKHW